MQTATHEQVADRLARYLCSGITGSDLTRFLTGHGLCIAGGAVHAAVVLGDGMPSLYRGDVDFFVSPSSPHCRFNTKALLRAIVKDADAEDLYLVSMVRPWQRDNGVVYIVRSSGPVVSVAWAKPFNPQASDFDGVANLYFPSQTNTYQVNTAAPLRIVNCEVDVAAMLEPFRPLQSPYVSDANTKESDDSLSFVKLSSPPSEVDDEPFYGVYTKTPSDCCTLVPLQTFSGLEICRVFCPRMLSRLVRVRKYLVKGHTTGNAELDAEIMALRFFGANNIEDAPIRIESAQSVALSVGPYQAVRVKRLVKNGDNFVFTDEQVDDWCEDCNNRMAVTYIQHFRVQELHDPDVFLATVGCFASTWSVPDICSQVPNDPIICGIIGRLPAKFCAIVNKHVAAGLQSRARPPSRLFTNSRQWAHEVGTLVPICAKQGVPDERLVVVAKSFVAVRVDPLPDGVSVLRSLMERPMDYFGWKATSFLSKDQLETLSWGGVVHVDHMMRGFLHDVTDDNWEMSQTCRSWSFAIRAKHLPLEEPEMRPLVIRTGSLGCYSTVNLGSIVMQPMSAVSKLLHATPVWTDIPAHFLEDCKELESITTTDPESVAVDSSSGVPRIILKRWFNAGGILGENPNTTSTIRLSDKFGSFGGFIRLVPFVPSECLSNGRQVHVFDSWLSTLSHFVVAPEDTVIIGLPLGVDDMVSRTWVVLKDVASFVSFTSKKSNGDAAQDHLSQLNLTMSHNTLVVINPWYRFVADQDFKDKHFDMNFALYVMGAVQLVTKDSVPQYKDLLQYVQFEGVHYNRAGVYPIESGHAVIGLAVVVTGRSSTQSLVLYSKKARPAAAPRALESVVVQLKCRLHVAVMRSSLSDEVLEEFKDVMPDDRNIPTTISMRFSRVIDPWQDALVPQVGQVPSLSQVCSALPANGMAFIMPTHMHRMRPQRNGGSGKTFFEQVAAVDGNTVMYDRICKLSSQLEPPACVSYEQNIVKIDFDRVDGLDDAKPKQ